MSAKTLLQWAGATAPPIRFDEAVLIVIDAQNEYVTGRLPLDGVAPALTNIAALLDAARASGAPVLHVVHRGGASGLFDPASDHFRIAPQAAPRLGERIIEKTLPNAVARTDLQAALVQTGRRQLILAGFMTHNCISATARAALDLDFRSTVVADASATRALPDPTGGADIAADLVHRATLAALADRTAGVARTADMIGV